MDESIRDTIKRRDGESDDVIDDMLAEARERIAAGEEDPQDVLEEIFGLELDYIFDAELGLC